jgi:hypothetical protein
LRSLKLYSHSRTSKNFMEPDGSIPCSEEPSNGPYPEPYQSNPLHPFLSILCNFLSLRSFIQGIRPNPVLLVYICDRLIYYGEELLAPRPAPKLGDNHLSAVRDCVFNIFAATLRNWRASPASACEDAPCRGDKGPT